MAINKNFVIKNGIQVNDNLLVGDPDNNKVGINTAIPDYDLHVIGGIGVTDARITGVTTALGDVLVADSTGEDGKAFAVRVSAGNSVGINTANPRYPLEVIGPASIGQIAEYVYGDLEVTGNVSFLGGSSLSGITTFTNTQDNTLGNPETGAVQIRGGLGVSKNATVGSGLTVGGDLKVGGGLTVTGNSYFVGMVTFAAGASGTIQLGDNANDNVEFQADVNSNIIPNATSAFDLGSSSQEWRDLHLASNAGIGSLAVTGISTFSDNVEITSLTDNRIPIVGAGSTIEDDANLTFDGSRLAVGVALTVSGISTFSGNIDADGDLDVDGHTELDDLNVSGVSTFASNLDINASVDISDDLVINDALNVVGLSTFGSDVDINADVDISGNAGIGSLNVVGVSTFASNLDINADIDVSGNAGIGSLNVVGLSTFGSDVDINADVDISGNAGIGSLTVSGISTFVGLSTFNAGLIVVSGVSTFLGNIDADGDLDVDGHTELDDLNVSGVSTFVGVSSFTNTTDNTLGDANTGAIKVDGGMGIAGNVTVGGGLSVTGNSYFVGMVTFAAGTDGNITIGDANTDNVVFNADVDSDFIPNTDAAYDLGSSSQKWGDFFAAGNAGIGSLHVAGVSTFVGVATFQNGIVVAGVTTYSDDVDINGNLDVDGRTDLDDLVVTGVSTYSADLDVNADIDVSGNAGIGSLNVVGVSTFGGITTFTDTTENTLGTTDTGAVKIAGGLAVAKNVTVGGGLSVTGNSYFVGMVTFAAGTDGNIVLGDTSGDNVVFNADVNSNLIPNTTATYDLGSNSQQWADLYLAGNAGVGSVHVAGISTFVGIATFNNGIVIHSGVSTFHSTVDINGNLEVSGNAGIGSLSVAGISTFVGLSTFNDGIIVVSGVSTFTDAIDANGDLDVDGHTELDDLNVTGVATFAQTEIDNLNVTGVTTTQTLHVGTGGTTLTVDAENATFAIGSATTTVTATMNGGAIPSIGLVIALGG